MQIRRGFLALALALPLVAATPGTPGDRVLSNEGLVVLARAGYNERFLIELIQTQPSRFDTSVEGLVYLAKQGISEKLVRIVIAEQKAAERRDAEQGDSNEPVKPAGANLPHGPVRMKMVKQKVLVPVGPLQQQFGTTSVIVVEKRAFGDRYYAMPGAQAPIVTPLPTPRAPQSAPGAAAQVAAFH